jgi:hypothetical protein
LERHHEIGDTLLALTALALFHFHTKNVIYYLS